MIDKQHLPLAGQRRKAREFALLGVYESLINKDADFAEIDAGLLSVITDADGPIAGCDLTPEDFDHCDQAFCREILAGVIDNRHKALHDRACVPDDRDVGTHELPGDALPRGD